MNTRTVTHVLITVGGDVRPFRVLALTAEQVAAGPLSMDRAKVRDAVQCETFRAAMSYANGVSHGLQLAGVSAPVVRDLIMASAECDATRLLSVNLIRE